MRSPRHQLARLVSAFLLLVALLGLVTPIGAAAQDASSPSGPTGESTFWTDRGDGCWVLVVDGEESVVSCYDEATGCTTETTVATGESTWSCNDPVTGCYTDSAGNTTCGDPTTGAVGWYQQADGCTAYWDGTQDAIVYCNDETTGCWSQTTPDSGTYWLCTDPVTGCYVDSNGYDGCAETTGGVWEDRGDGCQVYVENGVDLITVCTDAATGCYSETYAEGVGTSWWYCTDPVTGCYVDSAGNSTCGDPTTGAVGWYQQADGCTAYWDGTQDAVVQCTDAVTGCYLEVYPDGFSWWQCTDPATGCVTDSWGGDSCQTGSLPEGWYEDGVGCFVYWDGSVYSETSCVVPVPEPCTVDPVSGISSCQRGGGECFLSEDGMLACPTYMAPDVVPGPETAFSVGGGDVSQPAVTGSTTADESGAETPAMDSAPESEEDGPFDNGVRTFDGDDWYVTPRI